MRTQFLIVALLATPALAAPAQAQSRADVARWETAQDRFENERRIYEAERARFEAARARPGRRGYDYDPARAPGSWEDRYGSYRTEYDASRYYREGPNYRERRLTAQDEVYVGSDGRYYCKRNDGTTGLVIGAAVGGLLGNIIDGGRNRVGGTLIGGALGALAGKSIDQNSDVRCR